MNMTSIGDLAQSFLLRHRSVEIKRDIATLTEELSTGQVSDVSKRLGSDYSYLNDIDRNLARLDGFSLAASEAAFFAQASQNSLERLHDLSSSLSSSLIAFNPSSLDTVRDHMGLQAENDIKSAISALNASVGGRSLFAGTATDRSPLGSVGDMLDAVKAVVAGLTTATDVQTAVQAWFDDPAGFKSTMYGGAADTLAPIQVAPGEEVDLSLKADDQAFRDMFRNMTIVALAADTGLGFDRATQNALFKAAGDGLLATQDRLAGVRSDLGFAQARIEEAGTRNASAKTGLEYAKGALLEADPFETATRLEEAQFQLESLYTVTVRSSKLSLLNFMR